MLAVAFCSCLPSRQQEVDDGGKRYFQSHDSNRDGMLDLDECMRALQVNWPPATLLCVPLFGGQNTTQPLPRAPQESRPRVYRSIDRISA